MALTRISTDGIKDGTITGVDLATNVDLVDNKKIRFGTGNDLAISHDGTNSIIDNTTGELRIQTDGTMRMMCTAFNVVDENNSDTIINAQSDGAVEIYYDNSKKFETTSFGAQFTDNVKFDNPDTAGRDVLWAADYDSMRWQDNTKATFGDSDDLQIYHDGSNSRLKNTTGQLWLQSDTGIRFTDADVNESMAAFYDNGAVELYYDGSKKFETKSDGVLVTGELQATTLDINGNGHIDGTLQLTNDLFLGDNDILKIGSGNDLQLYHDGSASHVQDNVSNVLRISSDSIALQSGDKSEAGLVYSKNGSVDLYYDNSKKFETKSDGVQITDANPLVHIQGTGNSGDAALFLDANANHWIVRADNSGSQNTFSIKSGTPASSTHRLLINSSGDTFVNCTSDPASNNAKFAVQGGGDGMTVATFDFNASNSATNVTIKHGRAGAVSGTKVGKMIRFQNLSGTEVGTIESGLAGTSYNTSSDYRLKENITNISDGITRIKQLIPKKFSFIGDGDKTIKDGFLAHEVSNIVPEAITGTKDEVDSDNKPVYQGIDQSKLVPLLVAAVQEAISKIEVLETEVAALKAG